MIRILSGAAAALVLGVLTAFAARPPQSDSDLVCAGCYSGIMNWHPVLSMTDPNGNQCYVIGTIWRRDGTCKIEYSDSTEPPTVDCVPDSICQFIMQTQCTCGTDCQHIYVSMYNIDGTLVFSMPSQGTYIFGMPCNTMQYVVFVAHNTWTGEVTSQLNGFSCSDCKFEDPDGDGDGG
jgi:hypothetical protein